MNIILAALLALLPQQGLHPLTPQQQIDRAEPGDMVQIQSRSYTRGTLYIDKPLTVVGGWFDQVWTGPDAVTLRSVTVTTDVPLAYGSWSIGALGPIRLQDCFVQPDYGSGVIGQRRVVIEDSFVAGVRPMTWEDVGCALPYGWGVAVSAQDAVIRSSYVRSYGNPYQLWPGECGSLQACDLGRAAPAVQCSRLAYTADSTLIGAPAVDWVGFGACPDGAGLPYEADQVFVGAGLHHTLR